LNIQSVAAGVGAELHFLNETYDRNLALDLRYKGKEGLAGSIAPFSKNDLFSSLVFTDMDDLNAHLAFSALCILKERAQKDGVNGLYSTFTSLDVMSTAMQSSLQRRPPCRWEMHSVNSTGYDVLPPAKKSRSESPLSRLSDGTGANGTNIGDNETNSPSQIVSKELTVPIAVQVILDVGHNPAAMEALGRRIQGQFPRRGVR
jgi:hypothetical protein